MSLSRKNLSVVNNYSIDLETTDENTFSIQVLNLRDKQIVAHLPLDPMDNTLAGILSKDNMSDLGDDAAIILEALSKALQEHIGAKEFVLVPAGMELPGFVPAEKAEFKRLRHVSRADLQTKASAILAQHTDLVAELDKEYRFVADMPAITKKLQHDKPYEEIFALLEGHANFMPGKMTEYKNEDIQGKKARFNNSNVVPIAMLDSKHRLCGVIRCLTMGGRFGYLSDETINPEIIAADRFPGSSVDEQIKNRATFLLAYLASRASNFVTDHDHFLLIAAAGREGIYDAVGLQTFPIKSADYVVTMKLAKPAPLLTAIKEKLINHGKTAESTQSATSATTFSNAAAIGQLGALPAPAAGAVVPAAHATAARGQGEPTLPICKML